MNMEKPVHGSLNQERLLSQLGLEKFENILNIGMGAERFVEVFEEALQDLINPENHFALTPIKQMKILHTMLFQVNQDGANIHITKMLDAISDATHTKSASGQRQLLPEVLVTK